MANATSGVKNAATKLVGNVQDLGNSAANAFRTTGEALKSGGGTSGRLLMKPVEWTLNIVGWPIRMASGAYKAAPKTMAGATIVGGALLVRSFFRNRAEKRTQEDLQAQMMAPQGFAPEAAAAPVQSYKDSVSPAESAALDAKLKQGGAPTNFAAAETARQQQAQASQGTAVGAA